LLNRTAYFLALFLFSVNASAQNSGYTFLSWEDISLVAKNSVASDTNIIIITSRNFDGLNKDGRFLGNEIDPDGKLRYLVASCNRNSWSVCMKESFHEAMNCIKVNNDFLFLVHGDGKTFPDLLDRCIRTDRLYGLTMVVFDWPSRIPGYSRMRNYFNSRRNANASISSLKDALTIFENYRTENRPVKDTLHYSLFVHSLGNIILKGLVGESMNRSLHQKFDNVIMNAPAVKQKKHSVWVSKMDFQKRIYITSNQKDRTLYGAHIITFQKQLGEKLRKPLAKNAHYINLKNLVGKKHNYYLDLELFSQQPGIKTFYKDLFHGKELDPLNKEKFKSRKDGLGYDLL
jgi:hypothetical protein